MATKKEAKKQSTKENWIPGAIVAGGLFIVAAIGLIWALGNSSNSVQDEIVANNQTVEIPSRLESSALVVDYSKATIELDDILSGGPGKDGIPALTDPEFVRIADSTILDDTQVIVVENNGETKIYPYNILVWHEIVNDDVGGKPLAITFCPLCGSAIVFDREIDGEVVDFGVSGFLYESNLLMYSREESETLFSQSIGEGVVGERAGTQLTYFPLQVLTYGEAVSQFPNATVLSENTGFSRDYTGNPYSGYEDTEETIFPVSVSDMRFPAKEIFYIVPVEGVSFAMRQDKPDGTYTIPETDIKVTFDRGQITAQWGDQVLPGYYEMWFSWATHNQETGEVF